MSDTGRFRCWSCQAAGDIFDWVMRRRNVDFAEALQILAKEAGVTLKRGGGLPSSTRQVFETAMDAALDFFREQLARSPATLEYCRGRGLDEAVINEWQLGYAPEGGQLLPAVLRKKEVTMEDAKELFLVDVDSHGGYYSKFRGRLMFPIRDERGALVAFGGRILGDGHPKYINSSDTPLYRKSRVLYGMYKTRDEMARARRAVLVEGYLDVIACHRAGIGVAVASLGTSLSEDHAKLLRRWCDEVVILYDSDDAGQKAADRAVEILAAEGLRVRIALMPAGEDPDTLLKSSGPAAVQRAIDGGISPTDYRMRGLEARLDPKSEEFWPLATAILAEEPNSLDVVRHLDRLAGMYPATRDLELAKRALRGMIAKAGRARQAKQSGAAPSPAYAKAPAFLSELTSAEMVVIRAFLDDDFRLQAWMFCRKTDLFMSGLGQRISSAIERVFPTAPPTGKPSEWLGRFEDDELEKVLGDLQYNLRGERITEDYLADTISVLRDRLEARHRQEMIRDGADRSEIVRRLKESKPDPRDRKSEGDDRLF